MPRNILTRSGFDFLKAELDKLWREERPEVTRKVNWAASLGDRSENADYQYNKKRLREIDRRVRYLRKRLEHAQVVEQLPANTHQIYFGAWVAVENDSGNQKTFRIVGYDEIFDRSDYISVDSPMAQALLGKCVDDDVIVRTPSGTQEWWVLSISYPASNQ